MQINPQDLRLEVSSHTHRGIKVSSKVTITHIPTGEFATVEGRFGLRELAFYKLKEKLDAYPEQLELFE